MKETNRGGLFPALLKHWRGQRGLSQLDLALAADVSSRHVSFLETGRSTPSKEMVLRLARVLDVPLRHVNSMLEAAGFEPVYPDASDTSTIPDEVANALKMMKHHQEPYPLVVIDRCYNLVDLNNAALMLFQMIVPTISKKDKLNLALTTFDPDGAQPALVNFDEVGRVLLWRIQREVLADPNDAALHDLLDQVLAMPTVSDDWRQADLSVAASPAIPIHLRAGDNDLRFLTMVTAFQAPQTVWLDELRIETWFPYDAETSAACEAFR